MSYKENDYGSYESPNSIILGMVNESGFMTNSDGNETPIIDEDEDF